MIIVSNIRYARVGNKMSAEIPVDKYRQRLLSRKIEKYLLSHGLICKVEVG